MLHCPEEWTTREKRVPAEKETGSEKGMVRKAGDDVGGLGRLANGHSS